ncbi:MAG: OmpA family protein [Sporocytophaga sp.]|uniref:OmpA family protein n=1 Tax=Sporocytophaga sp. TaxID=2231183 RepID=UPI001B186A4E|nr:OmpA family protein [Sporocytophaga sp.]MBO9701062.1 OmpA family protein [Sporocytophaga sp.]
MKKQIIGILITCTAFSCVTKKKFDDLNVRKSALEAEKSECDALLKTAQAMNSKYSLDIDSLSKERRRLIDDSTQTGIVLRKTQRNYKNLNDTYEQLLRNHDRLQSQSSSDIDRMSKDLSKREKDLFDAEKKVNELQANLQEREAKVKELERVMAEKDKAVTDLKNKVSKALLSFKESDLSVNVKNGKVYVSLSEQLLFKSGSTDVDKKGVEALKKLADALKDQNDINILVEGHTDDVPVSKGTGGMKDNWDLSVLRATEIARILGTSGINPRRIVASGRSEFSPVAEGKTAEARQKNRRTEIILSPKLDELFQILENN